MRYVRIDTYDVYQVTPKKKSPAPAVIVVIIIIAAIIGSQDDKKKTKEGPNTSSPRHSLYEAPQPTDVVPTSNNGLEIPTDK